MSGQRTRPLEDRFWEKVDRRGTDDCWPWTAATDDHGYGVINAGGKYGRACKAHRVSAALAGMQIDGKVVRHNCDNPPCVNPAHLLVGSQADNIADMHARGRSGVSGERSHIARLTEADVIAIRASSKNNAQLAREYGVCRTNITAIRKRKSWKHLAAA